LITFNPRDIHYRVWYFKNNYNNASIYKARNASRNAESKALEKQTLEALAIFCSVGVAAVRRF